MKRGVGKVIDKNDRSFNRFNLFIVSFFGFCSSFDNIAVNMLFVD